MRVRLLAAAGLCLVASSAFADRPAGDKCAAGLSADAQAVYSATAPQVTPGADLRSLITAQARALVGSGTLTASSARPAAEAAGKCLMLINS
ncbi:MAG: hypothetical protein B7Z15_01585 [Rhizobiales bacterium 32-66-8]|nr:MAG: hypothetical protein B7Z15_01585 [Rhizobiales bacterium 32-66-8]